MRFCGIKTTHDGAVALIDDGELIFSYEMEKIDNNTRYAKIKDFSTVHALLDEHGYSPNDIDHFVFDGWHKTHKIRPWFGQELEIVLAPYRAGLLGGELFREYSYSVADLPYLSYAHYAGHSASAYCSSPFAANGESSYLLTWDGLMFPFLYYFDAERGTTHDLGPIFPMIGDTYYRLAQQFAPFDAPIEFPFVLGLAGKVMAYVALGTVDERAVAHLEQLSSDAARGAMADRRRTHGESYQLDLGADILDRMREGVKLEGIDDADMLASLHHFLEQRLLRDLDRKLADSEFGRGKVCISGGCGLNIKWNRAVRASGLFDDVWVPPFPNDAGSAIGAACSGMIARSQHRSLSWSVYAGPELNVSSALPGWRDDECDLAGLAKVLHEEAEPVVVLNGRAELGPRALGNRSILASAVDPATKDRLNEIKQRESYRPVAPICLEHRAPEVFSPGTPDPYMLFDHDVRDDWKPRVAAICHVDGTARIQTVTEDQNEVVFRLLSHYEELSGVPLLCNTSANFKNKGFFPDVASAMEWGQARYIWSNGRLYTKLDS